MSARYYAAEGDVRGGCGHRHQTIAAAVRCMDRDISACASLGGGVYSDRHVVAYETDGDRRPVRDSLTELERDELYYHEEARS